MIAGATFAVTAARARRRLADDQAHFALLRGAAEIADSVVTIPEVVERVGNLLVPAFADVCVIDVLRGDRVERARRRLRRAPTPRRSRSGCAAATRARPRRLRTGQPVLAEHVDEAHPARQRPRRGRLPVPALARRALAHPRPAALAREQRRHALAAGDHAQLHAGRPAAGPAAGRPRRPRARQRRPVRRAREALELEGRLRARPAQVQLTTPRSTRLAEAITIQDEHGTLVYANDAAADALGFGSGAQLMATPVREITDACDSFHEDGSPLRMEQLPGRQVIEGHTPEPMLVRAINRATGEERWRMVKATAVPVREGEPRLAVNVIEDVTEVKRAELAPALPRRGQRGAGLGAGLRADAGPGRRARRAAAGRLVRRDDARRGRAAALGRGRPQSTRPRCAFARDYERALPDRLDAPTGAAQVLRDGSSQLINGITDELLDAAIADPEQRAALAALGMRAVMIVPMVAGGRGIGVISFVSAESGPQLRAGRPRAGRGARAPRGHRGRERAPVPASARTSPRRSSAACCPRSCREIPGLRLASLYRPAGEENLVGGDFYDAFPTADGLDAARRRRHRPRRRGRGADRPGAPHAAHRRHAARRSRRRARAAQPGARAARRADPVHGRAVHARARRADRDGDLRRPSAAAARARRRGARRRALRPDARRLDATASWRAERVDCSSPATCSCSSATASPTPSARTGASARTRLLDDAARRHATPTARSPPSTRALNDFQRGAQADDTAVLALDLPDRT